MGLEFDAEGFACKLSREVQPGGRRKNVLTATFIGLDVSSFMMLAYMKSWFQAYLYGKIGTMKTNNCGYGDDFDGYLYFSKLQKEGEVFLHACVKHYGDIVEEVVLDYQKVVMIEIALNKCISFIDPD